MSQIWNSILDLFEQALGGLEQLFSFTGEASWGWAIIGLTLVIRLLLLPLAIKQIRSMRAMQAIQPQMKAIQKKYKADRDLMKKDPEQYKAKKQKMNEEMMALYQAEGVNPAASCLPLLAQAPVFFALFSILRGDRASELAGESFYFFTSLVPEEGLTALVSAAGWPGWLLIVTMAATMFVSQKQTMARQTATGGDNPMAQQQKVLLYVMPVFLAVISFNLPLGVLLYWVTTNAWQAVQQWFMLREVEHEVEEGTLGDHRGGEAAKKRSLLGKGKAAKNGKAAGNGVAGDQGGAGSTGGRGSSKGRNKPNPGATSSGAPDAGANGGPADPRGSEDGAKPARPAKPARSAKPTASGAKKHDHLPRRGPRA
ncbi:MAG: YidC/Oxa1 family membrane protein insertase [Nitriliruptor sp.]